ncbi:hypothetical protein FF38_00079 [Lucilia cuprina]|uniref:Uncharacterized protein n=1 Tax=Lucilia cuprina TaxID=7375 RepID=A0A0L0BL62_LUCCU|nr:hypothetical protein FF38_00079 [Lucilia cuprina]
MAACGLRGEITNLNSKFDDLSTKFDDFIYKGSDDRDFIKQSFVDAVSDLKKEMSSCVKELKSDTVDCNKSIRRVETSTDDHQAIYINKKKYILVKFNSTLIRDNIMDEYFKTIKTQPLMASDFVTDQKIPSSLLKKRVFLNEHYSPMAGKLNALCLKLRQNKIISKYKLINAEKPFAILTLPDNMIIERDAVCSQLP